MGQALLALMFILFACNAMAATLTAGYVPKALSGKVIVDSVIYEDGSNVGIGSASPRGKLDVDGWIYTDGALYTSYRIGVNNLSPSYDIDVKNENGRFWVQSAGGNVIAERYTTSGSGANFDTYTARGTQGARTISQNNDNAGNFSAKAYDGTSFERVGQIIFQVDGDMGENDSPGRMGIWLTPDGSSTLREAMRIDNQRRFGFGTTNTNVESGNNVKAAFGGNIRVYDTTNGLGAEKVTNGTFDTDTDWTKGTGWTISSGRARKSVDGTGALSQTSAGMVTPLVVGQWYTLSYGPSFTVDGSVYPTVGGVRLNSQNSSGTFNDQFQALTTEDLAFNNPVETSRFTIDNVSLKQMTDGSIYALGGIISDTDMMAPLVSVGTTIMASTANPLYVKGGVLLLTQADGNSGGIISTTGGSGSANGLLLHGSRTGSPIIFQTNSTERMRVTATGLGIGSATPRGKLDVDGSIYQSLTSTGFSSEKGICWHSSGRLGYCSSTLDASGNCTCN